MPLDPRSRQRLEALGRTLPQPLPTPQPLQPIRDPAAPRHAVETEENPEQLFRELMGASSDGNVPPHLLDRLRQLEQARSRRQPAAAPTASSSAPTSRTRRTSTANRAAAEPDASELYTAFAQLLLEDEELD